MELAVCVSDEDYEAWRQVRLAVLPDQRCLTVAELRAQETPQRLLVLARADGVVVGSGLGDLSDTTGAGFIAPRVLPEHRRRGVGTTLAAALVDHCRGLGVPEVVAHVDDEGAFAFARRLGFVEVDREVEQVRTVGAEPRPGGLPDGVEVVALAERPHLWAECYETFGKEVLADFAIHAPLDISPEQWAGPWAGDPMFLALHGGQVIGCAGLLRDADRPERAEHALTGVRRDWRGRGIAAHLKRLTLHWAAEHGVEEVSTWTQAGNVSMIGLNEHLGYTSRRTSITVSRQLADTASYDDDAAARV